MSLAHRRLIVAFAILFAGLTQGAAARPAARAELPRVFLETRYVAGTGARIEVHAGGDLQAALDRARRGDEIVLDAGAVFTGNYVLPAKGGIAAIILRSAQSDRLLEGFRVGPGDAAKMARIETPNASAALQAAPGARGWRFVGIEFGIAAGVPANFGVLRLGNGDETRIADLPRDIVVDRCWIHGNPDHDARRGIALNGIRLAVVDSHVSDFHEVGADSQAIAGWSGPGPFKIDNNYLEGAGENLMFGGADPPIEGVVPSDIEIRGNHLFKPLRWRAGDPAYAGHPWTVKNLFELKNAQRVLFDSNTLEHCWGDAQTGFAINLKSANQDRRAPWSRTTDVTLRNNRIRHAASAITLSGRDPHTPELTRRITIRNNLFEDIDGAAWRGSGIFLQVVAGPRDVVVEHNTVIQSGSTVVADGPPSARFEFTSNIAGHNRYGVKGDRTATGRETLQHYFPGARFAGNVLVARGRAADYPRGNFFPADWTAVGFVDFAGGDHALAVDSPYAGQGADGTDPGFHPGLPDDSGTGQPP